MGNAEADGVREQSGDRSPSLPHFLICSRGQNECPLLDGAIEPVPETACPAVFWLSILLACCWRLLPRDFSTFCRANFAKLLCSRLSCTSSLNLALLFGISLQRDIQALSVGSSKADLPSRGLLGATRLQRKVCYFKNPDACPGTWLSQLPLGQAA